MDLKPKNKEDLKESFCSKYKIPKEDFIKLLDFLKLKEFFSVRSFSGRFMVFLLFLIIGSVIALIGELLEKSFPTTSTFIYIAAGLTYCGGCIVPLIIYMDVS